ncbi:hypothetical protein V5N11_002515 [Cardamine amara subsp. amara]|uniref:Transposase MuDR plant domain-containing protein n=1 Tax=Cardamine amara subsp. amara TaxID=228776 RepID=A0ABD1BHI6_CARAN
MAGLAETFKKGIILEDIYGYQDIEPCFDDNEFSKVQVNQIDFTKENDAMFFGREFLTREDFKNDILIYAINRVFRFKFLKFTTKVIVAQCIDPKCDWRVTAHRIGDSDEYEVKKAKLDHICNVNT